MAVAPPRTYPIITTDGELYTLFNDEAIGRGAYSEVYKGRTASGRFVAVKTACKRVEVEAIRGEIEILQKLIGAPNIIQYIGSTHTIMAPGQVTKETISFAMEYARSSLEAEMRRPENLKGLSTDVFIDLVVDCSMALSTLKEHNIAHRDIKHMNILIFPGTPTRGRRSHHLFKLCDMGCSKELLESNKHEMRTLVGTPNLLHPHLAREMVDPRMERNVHDWKTKSAYTPEQCDLWSLGCTLYFCATGKFPFEHERNNRNLYHNAVMALTQNPNAIAMTPVIREKNSGKIEFQAITELPSQFTRYPKWLVCTMTCLLRNFFHSPSIEYYAKVANAIRTSKRRTFVSVDQMNIVDHTDLSKIPELAPHIPPISVCLGYPQGTNLLLLSNTSSQYVESTRETVDGLPDDVYLVVPMRNEVGLRPIQPRNTNYNEGEDMSDKKLAEVRMKKCYDGLDMLKEADEYCKVFDKAATILSTQFTLLVAELNQFERVQTTSRFAVYVDMASVPMILFDESNSETKTISERCIQQSKQAREELERHAKVALDIEGMAKQLAKDSEDLRLDALDFPGIREEIESYCLYLKPDVLSTRAYSSQLVNQCLNGRNYIMEQIFKSPDKIQKSKLCKAMNLAASLSQLRADYQRLQNTISECIDLLEKPFQEMKDIVNRCLQEKGHSRNSMQKSMHFLAPEFHENQKKIKKVTQSCRKLVDSLNQELEELGFVRMGDTLVKAETTDQEDTLKEETQTNKQEKESHEPSACVKSDPTSDDSTLSEHSSSITSFESTPPNSPPDESNNYFRAVFQYFAKPSPSPHSSP